MTPQGWMVDVWRGRSWVGWEPITIAPVTKREASEIMLELKAIGRPARIRRVEPSDGAS